MSLSGSAMALGRRHMLEQCLDRTLRSPAARHIVAGEAREEERALQVRVAGPLHRERELDSGVYGAGARSPRARFARSVWVAERIWRHAGPLGQQLDRGPDVPRRGRPRQPGKPDMLMSMRSETLARTELPQLCRAHIESLTARAFLVPKRRPET